MMLPFTRNLLIGAIVIIGVLLGIWLYLTGRAEAHEWYDGSCCSEKDCFQTVLREVKRTDAGWEVTINRTLENGLAINLVETIPYSDPRVRRSLDPLIHACVMPTKWVGLKPSEWNAIRCLYIPEVPV
jgi:hypothetical protein